MDASFSMAGPASSGLPLIFCQSNCAPGVVEPARNASPPPGLVGWIDTPSPKAVCGPNHPSVSQFKDGGGLTLFESAELSVGNLIDSDDVAMPLLDQLLAMAPSQEDGEGDVREGGDPVAAALRRARELAMGFNPPRQGESAVVSHGAAAAAGTRDAAAETAGNELRKRCPDAAGWARDVACQAAASQLVVAALRHVTEGKAERQREQLVKLRSRVFTGQPVRSSTLASRVSSFVTERREPDGPLSGSSPWGAAAVSGSLSTSVRSDRHQQHQHHQQHHHHQHQHFPGADFSCSSIRELGVTSVGSGGGGEYIVLEAGRPLRCSASNSPAAAALSDLRSSPGGVAIVVPSFATTTPTPTAAAAAAAAATPRLAVSCPATPLIPESVAANQKAHVDVACPKQHEWGEGSTNPSRLQLIVGTAVSSMRCEELYIVLCEQCAVPAIRAVRRMLALFDFEFDDASSDACYEAMLHAFDAQVHLLNNALIDTRFPYPGVTTLLPATPDVDTGADGGQSVDGPTHTPAISFKTALPQLRVEALDFSCVCLGPRGILPVLELLHSLSSLRLLSFEGCRIDDTIVELLLAIAARDLPVLAILDLRNNPKVTHRCSNALLRYAAAAPALLEVRLEGTLVRRATERAVDALCERRRGDVDDDDDDDTYRDECDCSDDRSYSRMVGGSASRPTIASTSKTSMELPLA